MEHHDTPETPTPNAEDQCFADPPLYPAGTPEYAAYADELRIELDKFAAGEPPYPYPPQ
jgi:hypothetical protein